MINFECAVNLYYEDEEQHNPQRSQEVSQKNESSEEDDHIDKYIIKSKKDEQKGKKDKRKEESKHLDRKQRKANLEKLISNLSDSYKQHQFSQEFVNKKNEREFINQNCSSVQQLSKQLLPMFIILTAINIIFQIIVMCHNMTHAHRLIPSLVVQVLSVAIFTIHFLLTRRF